MNDGEVLKTEADRLADTMVKWRRHLHTIPELKFELHRTSAFVKDVLYELGIPHETVAETGIVALISGSVEGKTVAIRADMDALQICESSDATYCSEHEGLMHACGHDAHMAIALGAARLLLKRRDMFKGSVKLIFQPAEEYGGGAERMITEGCLDDPRVDAMLTVHVSRLSDEIGLGQVGVTDGPIMAQVSAYSVDIDGEAAHVSRPHEGCDALRAAAAAITEAMTIPDTLQLKGGATLSVTAVRSEGAYNIIRDHAYFHGDIRTLHTDDERKVLEAFSSILQRIDDEMGTTSDIQITGTYPATVNDPGITASFKASALKIIPAEDLVMLQRPAFGSDDAALYMQRVPGTYFLLGMRRVDDLTSFPHHHNRFDVDDEVLPIGAALLAQAVLDLLS